MESVPKVPNKAAKMLGMLSIMVNVLPFYGNYYEAIRLCRTLSRNTRDTLWNEYHKAIWCVYNQDINTKISYKEEFDDLFAEYILGDNYTKNCAFNATLMVDPTKDENDKPYKSFIKFLKDLKSQRKNIEFNRILFLNLPDDITQFEEVIGLLYDIDCDKYKDKVILSDVSIRSCHEFQEPIYVSSLENPCNFKIVKECDTLVVNEEIANQSGQISDSFRCNKISFGENLTPRIFDTLCNRLHNSVKEHIKEVIFEYKTQEIQSEEESKFNTIKARISTITEYLPKISTIDVLNLRYEKDTFLTLLNY